MTIITEVINDNEKMKNIILLRHAKSSWKDLALNDFDRPLSKRGKRDAPLMAEKLLKQNINPDLIISSSSKRTINTAQIFAEALANKSDFKQSDKLYDASGYDILNYIKQINDLYNNIMVVGHNPAITNLANYLSDHLIENIPTAGFSGYSFNKYWSELNEKCCSFLFFDYPKKYF